MNKSIAIYSTLLLTIISCNQIAVAQSSTEKQILAPQLDSHFDPFSIQPFEFDLNQKANSLKMILSPSVESGGVSTGGGDQYVGDFMQTLFTEVSPWLDQNQDIIKAESLLNAAMTKHIRSASKVYESCKFIVKKLEDQSLVFEPVVSDVLAEPEREACYSQDLDTIFLSQNRYPLNVKKSPSKMRLVAHELLRSLHLEGGDYLISGHWNFTSPIKEEIFSKAAWLATLKISGAINELTEQAETGATLAPKYVLDKMNSVKVNSAIVTQFLQTQDNKKLEKNPLFVIQMISKGFADGLFGVSQIENGCRLWEQSHYQRNLPSKNLSILLSTETKCFSDTLAELATLYRDDPNSDTEAALKTLVYCVSGNRIGNH